MSVKMLTSLKIMHCMAFICPDMKSTLNYALYGIYMSRYEIYIKLCIVWHLYVQI